MNLQENPSSNSFELTSPNSFELNWKKFSYDYENPINKGKTKKVLKVLNSDWTENEEYYIIEEKNIASAWDWVRMEIVEWDDWLWKWDYSATINANYFKYLNDSWIETAFVKKIESNHTLVKKLHMIPVECVYRFVETGSYTKRQNHIKWKEANLEDTVLDEPIIELFYKDDVVDDKWETISDPLIKLDENQISVMDENNFLVLLYPKTWEQINYKKNTDTEKMKSQMEFIYKNHEILIDKTLKTWLAVKRFWEKVWLSTLDWKVEFWNTKDWKIILWDSIDTDSNRIRKVLTVVWEDWKTYLAKDFSEEELKQSWIEPSYFKNFTVIPDEIKVKELWLDKDWFIDLETEEEYLLKVQNLAELSSKALKIHEKEFKIQKKETCEKVSYII